MGQSQDLYKEALRVIPGGTQLFSKKAERYSPDKWPAFYKKAKGCRVWDLDGKEYIDMGLMGLGSCILGYADEDVNQAVKQVIDSGSMSTLNSPEDVELAHRLCDLHPWADMARYARSGGEAQSIAVRIARTFTGKDVVLFCGYHGWHDWYLAANLKNSNTLDQHLLSGLNPAGVPRGLIDTAHAFGYNNLEQFLELYNKYKDRLAAVVMEPTRQFQPEPGFLETIRQKTKESGAVLIFDEITSGWRSTLGGMHLNLDVIPDIAVFGKGISNGYPMAAVIGTRDVMLAANDTFISSTYWTERIGPTAALATIRKFQDHGVQDYIGQTGRLIRKGLREAASRHNIILSIGGMDPLLHFSFKYKNPLVYKTLFIEWMLAEGVLATTAFYATYAHKQSDIDHYLSAIDRVFYRLSQAHSDGGVEKVLKSTVCVSDFKRMT